MNVKNTSEQLKEGLNYTTIITPFHLACKRYCTTKRVNDAELSKYLWKLKEENVDCKSTVDRQSVCIFA